MGLSPRVRGNPPRQGVDALRVGSIPACAGEPSRRARGCGSRRVYPRVCGGTASSSGFAEAISGLSPRVRGNPRRRHLPCQRLGSIPACAGEPRSHAARSPCPRVYPRVCGGTQRVRLVRRQVEGLSPRVRGNQKMCASAAAMTGSIPACAGEPSAASPRRSCRRVYPRVCGGTRLGDGDRRFDEGLSPRVRGNPCRAGPAGRWRRSIPACAGEPTSCRM